MKKAIKIQITRAEGPTHLCDAPETFEGDSCWKKARAWLWLWSHTFPRNGGYDKHDFTVTFEDGETYEGRLDCKHFSCDDNDLDVAKHVRWHLEFMAGQYCPPHLSDERYKRVVADFGQAEQSAKFLLEYDIPTDLRRSA